MIENALLICFALFQTPASHVASAIGPHFPSDFKEKAFVHSCHLAQIGPRSQGAVGEQTAIDYVCHQFESAGLKVHVEDFDFEAFKIDRFDFTVCGNKVEPETIGFNPYNGTRQFEGVPLFLDPGVTGTQLSELDLTNKIIITTSSVDFFRLMFRGPDLIVYVSDSNFKTLSKKTPPTCRMIVTGALETHSSVNIVAELPSRTLTEKEIIVSAHWDAYRNSPGADDNGSGMGVLIELARFFSNFKTEFDATVKFVAFGAEELGVVGSRAYLNMHQHDLQNCLLVFNMDQIGGPRGPAVEMLGGVSGIPDRKGVTQFPTELRNRTFEGLEGRWRIVDPGMIKAFSVTNRPEWLVEVIEASIAQLGFQVRPTGNLGADQQVFTQAGIVATSIGFSGNQYHNPNDLPSQIHVDNLEITGKLVANVVLLASRNGK